MSSPEIAIKVTADTSSAAASIQSLNTAMVASGSASTAGFGTGVSNLRVLRNAMGDAGASMLSTTRTMVSGIGSMVSSVNGLYDAQQRVNVAQISYTLTVREYGAGSIQAARALDQLKVAQNGVGLAQLNLNLQYLNFALSIGPQLYATITKMAAASLGMTVQNYAETASWYAKAAAIGLTVGLLTAGIGVAAGLASAAMVNNTINQNNTFNQVGAGSTASLVDATNQSAVNSLKASTRP